MEGETSSAIHMAGGPVVADNTNVRCYASGAATSCGQKYCASGFHNSPVSSTININGIARISVCEGVTSRTFPSVGENDIARGASYGCHTLQICCVGTLGKEVGPLCIGKCTPHTGLIATIDDRIVETPVSISIEIGEVATIVVGSLSVLCIIG